VQILESGFLKGNDFILFTYDFRLTKK